MLALKNQEVKINLVKDFKRDVPHITKYMGSKRDILKFIIEGIDELYSGQRVCDLFAGTSILSGAIGHLVPMHSNDIQEYSSILANTYLSDYDWDKQPDILENIIKVSKAYIEKVHLEYPHLSFNYDGFLTIKKFNVIEKAQQNLINTDFPTLDYHLFIRNYSGTFWSYEQCLWIDAIRRTAEQYRNTSFYYPIISSLMYAMSYCSQSTGHYAQFRDATKQSNKEDILSYRRKEFEPLFRNKFLEFKTKLKGAHKPFRVTNLDYADCLDQIEVGSIVYADPPYAFVHYSRFYHVLETLVKYDYPEVLHKGRYRVDRHQSPFCQSTNVKQAFEKLFQKINEKNAHLLLSYSDTGMIEEDELLSILYGTLDDNYQIEIRSENHLHSTMGRDDNKDNEVQEFLITAKFK